MKKYDFISWVLFGILISILVGFFMTSKEHEIIKKQNETIIVKQDQIIFLLSKSYPEIIIEKVKKPIPKQEKDK